jgi:hypothetical protein
VTKIRYCDISKLATTEGSEPKCKKEYKKCALFRIEAGAEKCLADATKGDS